MKIAYGLLKFFQIADSQGYPVAEAHFQLMVGTDDEAARQLNLAIKMAEREERAQERSLRVLWWWLWPWGWSWWQGRQAGL